MKINLKEWLFSTWQLVKDYFYRLEFWRWQKRLDNKCKGCPFWVESTCGKTKKEQEKQEEQIVQTETEYFVKPKIVSRLLNLTVGTVCKYAKEGIIPAYNFRGHWLFRKDELALFIASSKYITCHGEKNSNDEVTYESGT